MCQLSPRSYAELLDAQCDKLVNVVCRVDRRAKHFSTLSVRLCRIELTTRCDDRRAVAKFSKYCVPDGSTLVFGDTRICL